MPLDGYDNVVQQGLQIAGLVDTPRSDEREGTSVVFESTSKGTPIQRVELRGRALPYRKVAWGVTQKVNTTYYPGNPVASQQVLGPEESPTVMKGIWKALYLTGHDGGAPTVLKNNTSAGNQPSDIVDLFQLMCRSGIVWRVTWLSEVRKGVMTKFTPTWIRQTDCEWEIDFEWSSRDDEDNIPLKSKGDKDSSLDLLGELNAFLDKVAAGPLVARQLLAMAVNDIRAIQETVSKAIDILASVEVLLSAPAHLIGAAKAALAQLGRQINIAIRRIVGSGQASATAIASLSQVNSGVRVRTSGQSLVAGTDGYDPQSGIPAETADKLSNGTVDPTQNGLGAGSGGASSSSATSGQLEFEAWRRDLAASMLRMFFIFQQSVLDLESRNAPATLKTVTVKEGETLYSISVREYGSPDYANWIAAANNLRSAILTPGQVLKIPARPTGPAKDPDIGSGDEIGPDGEGL